MKKRMLLSMLSLAAVVNAAPANLDKLDNELEIMSGVIDTALKQNNTRKGMKRQCIVIRSIVAVVGATVVRSSAQNDLSGKK